ncbi:MAG TPA: hypothetical protein VF766_13305 [Pyrinomonadaceae bacterium]
MSVMNKSWRQKFAAHRRDALLGLIIFAAALLTFLLSPVHELADSKYSMVVSQSLLKRGSFALDHYALPRMERTSQGDYVMNGDIYQLEWVGDHLYYYLPPGSSVLSVPYVALMNIFGLSAVNEDGTYNLENDLKLQIILAALLMAMLAGIFFFTSRLILPRGWSVILALGGVLGTQVWSTASRVLWSDTWGIFLLGVVVWMLLADAAGKHRLRPVWLASLLAWTYFVRPTYAIPILAISLYVLACRRRLFAHYALTGVIWLAGFIIYSGYHFKQLLPNYYLARRLTFDHFWEALAGNLISPGRGLFIYVPVLLFVAYLLVRHRLALAFPKLAWLALGVIIVHWIVTSGFPHWWGGYSYGPRLMTGVVPWLVLLGIMGVQAMLREQEERAALKRPLGWRIGHASGGLLLLASILFNALGATSYATAVWNTKPFSVDQQPSRVWDWKYPQFSAGLFRPPLPQIFPLTDARIDFTQQEAEPYLWYGWSMKEELYRWTDGREATVIFALDEIKDARLRIKLAPLLVSGKLEEQRVKIELNGQPLEKLTLREAVAQEYSRALPKEMLRPQNVLTFGLPDAASPRSLNLNADPRQLAIAVFWLEINTQDLIER